MKITKLNDKVIIIDGQQSKLYIDNPKLEEGETMMSKAKELFTFEGFEDIDFHITNFVFVPKENHLDFRIEL